MGLCKCPKRRVTNQFCFEHRVNVCEHCMVTNHQKCIIQSYLQWLQDSDYSPICELCMKELQTEDCIRLTCYHVFHWACLDHNSRQLPPTTAPAGYRCPSCRISLFPPSNLVSPVADVLREKLAGVNWARAGLGLPLLSEDKENKPLPIHNHIITASTSNSVNSSSYSVVHVDDQNVAFNREKNDYQSRRVFQNIQDIHENLNDHDDDKYKRRPAGEKILQMWKNFNGPFPTRRFRYIKWGLLALFLFILMILLMSHFGKIHADNDPYLMMPENPNIIK